MGMFFRKQKPAGNDNRQRSSPPTFIGEESTIEGTVDTDGELHIEGRVQGVVKAALCVIGARGIIEGQVEADEIIVRGRIVGPLRAGHVHLEPEASVEGDITCETIAIDNGARLSGAVWQQASAGAQKIAAPLRPPASRLFSEPLWSGPEEEDVRPLRAVRPRN